METITEEIKINKPSAQLLNYRRNRDAIAEKKKLKYIQIKDDEEFKNKNKINSQIYYNTFKKSDRVKLTDEQKKERRTIANIKYNAKQKEKQKQTKETAI